MEPDDFTYRVYTVHNDLENSTEAATSSKRMKTIYHGIMSQNTWIFIHAVKSSNLALSKQWTKPYHILNISTIWRLVVSFMPQLLYPFENVRPYTHWMVGWTVPRLGHNNFEKRKISCPAKKRTRDPPAITTSLHQLHKPSSLMGAHASRACGTMQ